MLPQLRPGGGHDPGQECGLLRHLQQLRLPLSLVPGPLQEILWTLLRQKMETITDQFFICRILVGQNILHNFNIN